MIVALEIVLTTLKIWQILIAPKLKQPVQAWDNVEGVFDAFKRVEDKSMAGVSLGRKNFPLIYAEGNTTFISKNAKQYQAEASGDGALSFVKGGISWDNLDEAGKLVERKYGHGSSIFKEVDDGSGGKLISVHNKKREEAILEQAEKQALSLPCSFPIKEYEYSNGNENRFLGRE